MKVKRLSEGLGVVWYFPKGEKPKGGHTGFTERMLHYRQELIEHQTEAEGLLQDILDKRKFNYEFQKIFIVETDQSREGKIVDFYLPDHCLIIEVDGGYHKTLKQVKADYIRERQLSKLKYVYNIMRFSNEEIMNLSEKKIIMRIKSYI